MRKNSALLICGLLGSPYAAAEDSDLFFAPLPEVLSATRLATARADTPAAVTVIDRELLRASGVREIAEIFRLVAGMQAGFPSGHQHAVTYHGLGDQLARGMQVLIDGRSVYSPVFGGVNWADLPLAIEDIERIEVIRGPNAAAFGSNSFTGVINITTRHSGDESARVAVRQSTGSDGIYTGQARVAGAFGSVAVRLNAEYRRDQGFDARLDDKRTSLFNARVDYQPSDRDSLSLFTGASAGIRQDGFFSAGTTTPSEGDPPRTFSFNSHFLHLIWEHEHDTPDATTRVQLYRNYHHREDQIGGQTTTLPLDADRTGVRNDIEIQTSRVLLNNALRAVFGGSYRLDRITAPSLLGDTDVDRLRTLRVFGNLEWRPWQDLVVNTGVMWERHSIGGYHLSPRVAANYSLFPGHTLRAVVSSATRVPLAIEDRANTTFRANVPVPIPGTIFDPVDGDGFINTGDPVRIVTSTTDLKPVSILSQELGYLAEVPAWQLQLDVKLFHEKLRNVISATKTLDVIQSPIIGNTSQVGWFNIGTATITGIEAQLDWHLTAATRLWASFSRMEAIATANVPFPFSKNPAQDFEDSVPETIFSVLVAHDFAAGLQASASYYRIGKHAWFGEGTSINATTPTFDADINRLDLRLAKTFAHGGQRFRLTAVVQNALGEYLDFYREKNHPDQRNIFEPRLLFTLNADID